MTKLHKVSKEDLVDYDARYFIITSAHLKGLWGKYVNDLPNDPTKKSIIENCLFIPEKLVMFCDFWRATHIWKEVEDGPNDQLGFAVCCDFVVCSYVLFEKVDEIKLMFYLVSLAINPEETYEFKYCLRIK